jgi:tRNA (Thr-GGU) A37 N-methylase
MSSCREKSTGARSTFTACPLGKIKSTDEKRFSVLALKPEYLRGIEGLEKFREILVIYHRNGELGVHVAELKKITGTALYITYSDSVEGAEVLDIKPFFKELDE